MTAPADQARQLLRDGRTTEAEQAFERLLETDPAHVEALNVLALSALNAGRASRALALLERACAADPNDAASWHHSARAHEAAGNPAAALTAHRRAVELHAPFFIARLYYASALERAGRAHEALAQFTRSVADAQKAGRWLDPDTTPASMRPLVEHAVRTVRSGRRVLFEQVLAPLRERYGRADLTRVEQCLAIYLGEVAPEWPDPRQRPTFLYFPGLPTTAYFERGLFRGIEALEAATHAIREELLDLLPAERGRERVFKTDVEETHGLRGHGAAPSWTGFYFYRYGERREENCVRCPATARALEALPLGQIREHAPEVLFSVFTPGTHLLPHRGVTNTRAVSHLPLLVPADCALNVGGEVHHWQEGRVVVFDDTYEHEAWNHSDRTRVVLIADLWNPHLAEVERAAVTDLVTAIGDLRKRSDAGATA